MSIRWKFLLTILLALTINFIVGYYAAKTYKGATEESARIRDTTSRIVTSALTAQVHFKKQVQEWKNILLRGHEEALYNKYLGQFYAEEKQTRLETRKLLSLLEVKSNAYHIANTFLLSHQHLGRQYRDALKLYDKSDPLSHLQVDKKVRGIDRRPTDLIDDAVQSVLQTQARHLETSGKNLQHIEEQILIVVICILLLTIFTLIMLSDKMIASPITLATAVARRISEGNLSSPVPVGGDDEAGQLLKALEVMQHNLLSTQDDLRQEKQLLEQRVQARTKELNFVNEELARAAKAKDLFLATMSHELRTPLTTLLGLTEMLKDQLYGPINESQERALQTVDESAQHLLTLINDILDVAKVESGMMELKFDFIPIDQLVEASLRLIRAPAQRKHQQLEYHIDPIMKLIYGDSRRLKQLLVNLLGNAVKFTQEEGKIGIEIAADAAENRVHITVWDNGIGIEEGQLERLFEPFVQLDNEPTRRYSGTGLGLTLVNRMVLLHKGSIQVESSPGNGSRFIVSLPWDKAHNEPSSLEWMNENEEQTTIPQTRINETSILLAEDNPANRTMTTQFLEQQGFRILAAEDGPEALQLAMEHRPDLILMDIKLDGLSGLEVTKRLRNIPGYTRLPIIALTAMAMPGDREQCLEAGMDDYISKPVGLKELHHHILQHLKFTCS